MKAIVRIAEVSLFFNACALYGGPFAYRPLSQLAASADAIVIGSADSVSTAGSGLAVSIVVERTLKGTPIPQSRVSAIWLASAGPTPAPAVSTAHGIWFLKGQNSLEILPLGSGDVTFRNLYIPTPSNAGALPTAYAYSAAAPVNDKLAAEIGAAIESSNGGAMVTHLVTLGSLDKNNFSALAQIYERWTHAASPRLRAVGLDAKIRNGEPAALSQLTNDTDALQEFGRAPDLQLAICEFRSLDAAAIPTLARLGQASQPSRVQFCAALALRSIHSASAAPVLAAMLDSSSRDVRYQAVAGLASFANNLPMQAPQNTSNTVLLGGTQKGPYTTSDTLANFPTRQTFNADEAKYTLFWKSWWASHQGSIH